MGFCATNAFAEFNSKFAVAAQKGTAFLRLRRKDLDWIFGAKHERTVNRGNTVLLENRVFQIELTGWRNTLAGQTVVIPEHLDWRIDPAWTALDCAIQRR